MIDVVPRHPERWIATAAILLATVPTGIIHGCSRALFNQYSDSIVVSGRSMDWQHSFEDLLFVYPRGIDMDGGTGEDLIPTTWTSKYGCIVSSIIPWAKQFGYDFTHDGATDGINEVGLAVHLLYLEETKYPEPNAGGRKNLTYLRWVRYILDNFSTVSEAVVAMQGVNIMPALLNGIALGAHMAIEDPSGDSAVFEIIEGKVTIYHGKEVRIMTNDPAYDKQLQLLQKFDGFGGDLPLPGSTSSEDRFVRLSYFLPYLKKPKDDLEAVAKMQSLMMSTNVPFDAPYGMLGKGIYPTWWNSYCDLTNLVYYFTWLETPFMLWVELKDLDFSPGGDVLVLDPKDPTIYGDMSSQFTKSIDFAAVLSSLFFEDSISIGKAHSVIHPKNFTIISAALIGSMFGFFIHKLMAARLSHYHPITEEITLST